MNNLKLESEVSLLVEELLIKKLEEKHVYVTSIIPDKKMFDDYDFKYLDLASVIYEVDNKYELENDDYIQFDENGDITMENLIKQIITEINKSDYDVLYI